MKTDSFIAKHKVDVVLRDGSKVAHFVGTEKLTVPVSGNDVVVIHASQKFVIRYVRVGNDLLIFTLMTAQ